MSPWYFLGSPSAHHIHLPTVNWEKNKVRQAFQELKHCYMNLSFRNNDLAVTSSSFLVYSNFVDNFDFNISFSNGILKISPLHIKGTMEVKWRNLIAWEQSRMGVRCRFSCAMFFKSLICCKHDILLLEKMRFIVKDSSKSKEDWNGTHGPSLHSKGFK